MKLSDYLEYQFEDFIQDSNFLKWVKDPSQESNEFWETFRSTYPLQIEELQKAKAFLLQFEETYEQNVLMPQELSSNFEQLLAKTSHNSKSKKRVSFPFARYAVAASVLLIMGSLYWFRVLNYSISQYTTGNGEHQTIELPDGSIVQLNANSSLVVHNNWDDSIIRNVSLEGEAYFQVEEKPSINAKFEVETKHTVIQVLGTVFNVETRKDKTSVFLEEGKIKLIEMASIETSIELEVGEVANVYNNGQYDIVKQTLENKAEHTSWKDGVLTLNEVPLTEVLIQLESIYGISFLIENKALEKRNLSFIIPIKELEESINILEKILQIQIAESEDVYILK